MNREDAAEERQSDARQCEEASGPSWYKRVSDQIILCRMRNPRLRGALRRLAQIKSQSGLQEEF